MSLKYLINEIETFCSSHPANVKFFAEFTEQMPNLATIDEQYPLVFFVFAPSVPSLNVVNYTAEIYVLDKIRDKRDNIIDLMSDTGQIINDIYQNFNGIHPSIDVSTLPTFNPLNNFDLDYVAGWQGTFDFELPQICGNLV
jgi:hypothetical protein